WRTCGASARWCKARFRHVPAARIPLRPGRSQAYGPAPSQRCDGRRRLSDRSIAADFVRKPWGDVVNRDSIERVYSTYARIYDHLFGRVFQEGREAAMARMAPQAGERILEVGVGTGLLLPLYPSHCEIVG